MIEKIAYELLCTDNYYNDVCFDYIVIPPKVYTINY